MNGGSAWLYLTREPQDQRKPEAALPLAQTANQLTNNKEPGYMDTLALAYFSTGDVASAISTQKKALALPASEDSAIRTELETTLAKYEEALRADADTVQPSD